jgi:folate-dependent phosphoribosylglycinamide formyltransferase PurN
VVRSRERTDDLATVRVVVLTSGGRYAERILTGLGLIDVVPSAVVVTESSARRSKPRLRRFLRRPSRTSVLRAVMHAAETRIRRESSFTGLAGEVRAAGPLNGRQMYETLRELEPDLLVLAGVGIVDAPTLEIPRIGTLNAHPALLPWIRGVGVVEGALLRDIAIGATAHLVDPDIDTGPIIRRQLVAAHRADSLVSLRHKAYETCAQLMIETVAHVARTEPLESVPQTARFPMCHWPTAIERARLEVAIRTGLPERLYHQWASFYGSDHLPPGDDRIPPAIAPVGV